MNRLDETMEGMSSKLRSRATGKHRRVGSVDCTRSLHQLYTDANRILELQSQAQGFVTAVQRPDAAQSSSGATPPAANASPQVAAPGMVVTIPVDAGEKSSILFLDTTAEASSPGADGAGSDSLLYKNLDSSFRYPAICVPSPRFESCSPIAPQATTTPLRPERPEVPTPHSRNERRAVSPKNPRHAGEKKLQADPVFLPPAGGQQDALGKKRPARIPAPNKNVGLASNTRPHHKGNPTCAWKTSRHYCPLHLPLETLSTPPPTGNLSCYRQRTSNSRPNPEMALVAPV
ncbi:hypothetical protein V5799_025212 [Amblyomma americanum]|uniref:Uncharacterized protein n=1 Tax=Amblyomma americanum TaxID=6943 RepID=A0AAQ4EA38_AMBAM